MAARLLEHLVAVEFEIAHRLHPPDVALWGTVILANAVRDENVTMD